GRPALGGAPPPAAARQGARTPGAFPFLQAGPHTPAGSRRPARVGGRVVPGRHAGGPGRVHAPAGVGGRSRGRRARAARSGARAEPLAAPASRALLSPERRRAEHRAVAQALLPGAPRRFVHMAAALSQKPAEAEVVALAEEAIALGRRLMHGGEGELGLAMA